MANMNMIQAINSAHKVMMARDTDIVVFGEDIGYFGGVFRATEGLQREFGNNRVFDAPISEGGIVATAVGMAAYGLKPVVEIQFADYIYPGYDQIVSESPRWLPHRRRRAMRWSSAAPRRRHLPRPAPQPSPESLSRPSRPQTVLQRRVHSKGPLIAASRIRPSLLRAQPHNGPLSATRRP